MATLPILKGPRVTLRRPTPDDVAARQALGNDPAIVRMYGGQSSSAGAMSREAAEKWVQSIESQQHAWIIDVRGLIGSVRLHSMSAADHRAALAIGIDDACKLGQGLGSETIRLVLGHAFGSMALHRVSLRVLAINTRAIRAYEKCGFVIEGREREAALVDGVRYDDVMMGVLIHEFRRS